MVQWRAVEGRMNVSLLFHSLASLHPGPLHSPYGGGTFSLCFTSCQAVVWAACGALSRLIPERNSIAFFLFIEFYEMIPIAIIINNIMIALVTVIVVITGITIMNT